MKKKVTFVLDDALETIESQQSEIESLSSSLEDSQKICEEQSGIISTLRGQGARLYALLTSQKPAEENTEKESSSSNYSPNMF